MKIKNLYVVDEIIPMSIMGSICSKIEDAIVARNQICEKVETKECVYYLDLESNKKYYYTDKIGANRVEIPGTPLSDYFYPFGLKKKNPHDNQDKVYDKVKELKKKGII